MSTPPTEQHWPTALELGKKRAEELGLQMKQPTNTVRYFGQLHDIYYRADDIHRLLGEGVEANGSIYDKGERMWYYEKTVDTRPGSSHQALLIGITPIKQATREERAMALLNKFIAELDSEPTRESAFGHNREISFSPQRVDELVKEAKLLAEVENGK